jgi:hypothetical protein
MTIAVLVITDGRRDCITRTIPSAIERLHGDITEWWIYDDSDDPRNRAWLAETWPTFELLWHPDGRQGFGGAIRFAWDALREGSKADHIFHLEDDFTFNRDVDLDDVAKILGHYPEIAQIALRRQPWNDVEVAAGGVVEAQPEAYSERSGWLGDNRVVSWLEQRVFWTTNPSLFRRDLLDRFKWPDGHHSEGVFSRQIRDADPENVFAYWGKRDSGEWVCHIGDHRSGTGY